MKKKILLILLIVAGFWACKNEKKDAQVNTEKAQQESPQNKQEDTQIDHKAYKMKGMLIAKSTFKVFKSKIEEIGPKEGLPAVVGFCHDNALKLTDSLGEKYHVVIKRTSHKLRNPDNKPTAEEQKIIDQYLQQQKENKQLEPVVQTDEEGYVHFYAPIKLKEKCLQCHGQPGSDIHEEVYKVIKEKYPEDQATGFKKGEFRGIWDIKFLKEKE